MKKKRSPLYELHVGLSALLLYVVLLEMVSKVLTVDGIVKGELWRVEERILGQSMNSLEIADGGDSSRTMGKQPLI